MTHQLRQQTYSDQGGKVEGRDRLKFWVDMYALLDLKQIANKNLLHSTGNSAQYSVIT